VSLRIRRLRFTLGFGVLESQLSTFLALFFLECSNWSTRSVDVCPPTDRWSSSPSALRASGISKLNFTSFTFSRSVFPRTAQIYAMRPSGNRRPGSSSTLGSSTIWFPSQPQTPEVIRTGVVDRAPPVSLDDGWSLLTSGLWDFDKSTLLRSSKGLTFVHLSLDPTTVDPHAQIQWIRSVLLLDLTVVLTPEMYLRSTTESDFGPSSLGLQDF
jgi:hypothetical protein